VFQNNKGIKMLLKLEKLQKLNTVQKILCLLVLAILIAGKEIFRSMGISSSNRDEIMLATIVVSLVGIYFFKDKPEE
jgi:hypothetical protein